MASRITTMMAIGIRTSSACIPPAGTSTTRISSVAYAVDELASEANTANAMSLMSRCWCSSADAIGGARKPRLSVEYIGVRSPADYVPTVHVVIVGCGRVGSALALNLTSAGHTVAIID